MLNLDPTIYPQAKLDLIVGLIGRSLFFESLLLLALLMVHKFKPRLTGIAVIFFSVCELFIFARGNLITSAVGNLTIPEISLNMNLDRYLSTSDALAYVGPGVYWNHLRVRQPLAPNLSDQELIDFPRLKQEISMYPGNLNVFPRWFNVSGYSAVVLKSFAAYFGSELVNSIFIPSLSDPRLELLGVNYLISGYPDDYVQNLPGFTKIYDQPAIYRSTSPHPRIKTASGRGKVSIISYQSQQIDLSVSADQSDTLIIADSFYPGWEAFIDGDLVPITAYENAFRAISIPAGNHQISIRYRPFSVTIGAAISLFTLVFLTTLLLYEKTHRRHNSPQLEWFKRHAGLSGKSHSGQTAAD